MKLNMATLKSVATARKQRTIPTIEGKVVEAYTVTRIVLECEDLAPSAIADLSKLHEAQTIEAAFGLQLEMREP